jgi:hypothetical protein
MLTGYEQVRSVVAAIAGDMEAANDIHLVQPETGVCSLHVCVEALGTTGCCGGPAPGSGSACCKADAVAKATTGQGCECGSSKTSSAARTSNQLRPLRFIGQSVRRTEPQAPKCLTLWRSLGALITEQYQKVCQTFATERSQVISMA